MHTGRSAAKVYNAETHDPYETVVASYRKRLVGAKDILSIVLPATVFIERVRSGDIDDLKTLVAGYWFAERQEAGSGSAQRFEDLHSISG